VNDVGIIELLKYQYLLYSMAQDNS